MGMRRHALAQLACGAGLLGACAGCGGGSTAPTGTSASAAGTSPNTPQTAAPSSTTTAPSTTPPPVVVRTPQQAVHQYVQGIHTADGAVLCAIMDSGLRRALIQQVVQANPVEAKDTCAQALTALAAAITSPGESAPRLPALHVTTMGGTAVVSYVGLRSHTRRTFTLVRHGRGWLLDRINGRG